MEITLTQKTEIFCIGKFGRLLPNFRCTIVAEMNGFLLWEHTTRRRQSRLASVPQPNVGFSCRPMFSYYSKGLL